MAAEFKWAAFGESLTAYLSTGLNSLANGAFSALGADIANQSDLYEWMELELVLGTQGSARSAGAAVDIYGSFAADDTNYGSDSVQGLVSNFVARFDLDAATTARTLTVITRIYPVKFKLQALNVTGQAFPPTGNTLRYRRFNAQSV